jgi:hypothetical protein
MNASVRTMSSEDAEANVLMSSALYRAEDVRTSVEDRNEERVTDMSNRLAVLEAAETNPTFEVRTVALSAIKFDEALYPRKEHDPELVQKYLGSLEVIEAEQKFPSVLEDLRLLDGKHRWLAYRTKHEGVDAEIKVRVYTGITTEAEAYALAVKLNSDHGWQLTEEDKKQSAIKLYGFGYSYDRIAKDLSVGKAKVVEWLARTVKEQRENQNAKIQTMWLACFTQDEISAALDIPRKTIDDRLKVLAEQYRQNQSAKITFQDGSFDPPIYNVWKQQDRTAGVSHFGNSEQRWVENLLYLYTEPFDVVVDPFAGSGSTIDVCKRRGRRYFVSDRKPIVARENEIRQHDITTGLPPLPRWQDVKLVYLDPPYWAQAAGEYSDDPTDLANMSLENFTNQLAGTINGFAKKLPSGAAIALIIQPTQWRAPERQFTHHAADMIKLVKLPIDMCIQAPYESQQCNAQMVEWAKANRTILVLSREIVVWRKP